MTTLIMDADLLQLYLNHTPAPVVEDTQLEAWASYFCGEPRLHRAYYFDLFISNPVRYCREAGVLPRPHNAALPDFYDMRRLLPVQRVVMGRIV